MSIAVALLGADTAVVATDSRCISAQGVLRDDCDKTFELLEGSLIGACTGLRGC